MRYGILSDIHGNFEALQAVVDLTKTENVESYFCVGDIVGYGANPKECLDFVRELKAVSIAGNHDWAVSGKINTVGFNQVAKQSVIWTQKQLSSEDISFLSSLRLIFKNDDFILVHGTLSEPEHFHYMITLPQALETFCLMDRNLCFVGHSHVPQIIMQKGEEAQCLNTLKIEIDPANKYIINVGSVGQPRDGNPKAIFCIYDTETRMIEIKRTSYDIALAQEKVFISGLPMSLVERLAIGR